MASKFDALVDQIKDSTVRAMVRNGDSMSDILFRMSGKNRHDANLLRQLDRTITRDRRRIDRAERVDAKPGHNDVGQYGDLQAVARRNGGQGGLEYDHIPSKAALVRALEDRYGRTLYPWERNAVERDATAVAITDVQHRAGRTHGYKNSDAQIQQDAADLPAAMEADLAAHRSTLRAQGVPSTTIDEILAGIRRANHGRW